jgi:NAD(P) transhydrogenase
MLQFDVAVVGSGPAGERGAARAAFLGKKACLIEKEAVPGGACANTGTIPSKALRETALTLLQARRRDVHGFLLQVADTVTVPALMGRRGLVTAREHTRIRERLSAFGVETFRGTASFVDAHTLRVSPDDGDHQDIRAGIILLAPGTRPLHPPAMGVDHSRVYDSDSILMLDRVPRSLAVLGGGVAGCEYASIFAALGVHVSMVDSRERLMPFLDAELSRELEGIWKDSGLEVKHRTRAVKVEAGDRDVLVTLTDGSRLVAEKVLVGAGRVGNVEALNLEAAGLRADDRGYLKVNEHFQTEVPHVYAAGDVVGFPGLAATAMEQGRVAMTHACGGTDFRTELGGLVPTGIYTLPEISSVGRTEEALREAGVPYVVGRSGFVDNVRANLIGEAVGWAKILVSPESEKVLGVHAIGPHASELVHLGAAVMDLSGTYRYFIDAVFNYPTLGEVYKHAGYDARARVAEWRAARRATGGRAG